MLSVPVTPQEIKLVPRSNPAPYWHYNSRKFDVSVASMLALVRWHEEGRLGFSISCADIENHGEALSAANKWISELSKRGWTGTIKDVEQDGYPGLFRVFVDFNEAQ